MHSEGEGMKAEQQIQNAILEYLTARRIWGMRINVGAMAVGKRFLRFGIPGCADIFALYPVYDGRGFTPVWVEVKSNIGRLSELQKSFQMDVVQRGHQYLVARSVEDVKEFLKEL